MAIMAGTITMPNPGKLQAFFAAQSNEVFTTHQEVKIGIIAKPIMSPIILHCLNLFDNKYTSKDMDSDIKSIGNKNNVMKNGTIDEVNVPVIMKNTIKNTFIMSIVSINLIAN